MVRDSFEDLEVNDETIKAFSSVQFSSVHFYLAKIQYNKRIHIGIVRLKGSPEETRRLYEA